MKKKFILSENFINKYKSKIKILAFPTVRDKRGLALSSRNSLLNKKQMVIAAYLFKTIRYISKKAVANPKKINELKKWGKQKLLDHGFDHVDYIEIYNENNFSEIGITRKNLRVFAAATLGKVRLIDNCVVR